MSPFSSRAGEMVNKTKKRQVLIIGISVVLLFPGTFLESRAEESCNIEDIPEQGRQLIAQKFPGWRGWGLSDLTKEEKDHWSKNENKSNCPGLAIGHFESKANLSYALSLIPVDQKKRGWRLVVISKNRQGVYQEKILRRRDDLTGTGVLYKASPGKYSDPEESQSVRLTLDGVIYEEYEKGAILFYWRNGRYNELDIDD